MKVKTWKNEKRDEKNATFGIAIAHQDVPVFAGLTQINLQINGSEAIKVNITKSFDNNCHEIRDKAIGTFFAENNIDTWEENEKPELTLTQVNATTFNLTYP